MNTLLLNCGCLWDDSYLERVIDLNKKYGEIQVVEMFGSIPELTPSARSSWRIPQGLKLDFVESYIRKAQSHGIQINYTWNQSCPGRLDDWEDQVPKLKESLNQLWDLGIHKFTVALPLIAKIIREEKPKAEIKASTICRTESTQEIDYWIGLGATGITSELNINRNFPLVRKLNTYCSQRGVVMEVLASEFCNFRCSLRYNGCYSSQSHNSSPGAMNHFPWGWCTEIKRKDPSQFIKARAILPQHLRKYHELTGVSHFKITTRTAGVDRALWILEQYLGERYDGNIVDLWSVSHLAGEEELQIYISGARLDGLMDAFTKVGPRCDSISCDSCQTCLRFYQEALERRENV